MGTYSHSRSNLRSPYASACPEVHNFARLRLYRVLKQLAPSQYKEEFVGNVQVVSHFLESRLLDGIEPNDSLDVLHEIET